MFTSIIKELSGTKMAECNENVKTLNWWIWQQQGSFLEKLKSFSDTIDFKYS